MFVQNAIARQIGFVGIGFEAVESGNDLGAKSGLQDGASGLTIEEPVPKGAMMFLERRDIGLHNFRQGVVSLFFVGDEDARKDHDLGLPLPEFG